MNTTEKLADAAQTVIDEYRQRFAAWSPGQLFGPIDPAIEALIAALAERQQVAGAAQPGPEAAKGVPQGPRTEFVLNELRSALNAMLTFFGMDEDENSKALFDQARQAYNYAQLVMRPLEPWERQSLGDLRACLSRWHEKTVEKGYDGIGAMCETALPYGTRDLRLVTPPAPETQKGDQ